MLDFLLKLVALGGLGASLAFLYLGYRLLKEERGLKAPRTSILISIFGFLAIAFVFFIAGSGVELVFRAMPDFGKEVVEAMIKNLSRNHYIRKHFREADFKLSEMKLKYIVVDDVFDSTRFVEQDNLKNFLFFVAIRPSSTIPDEKGAYLITDGPYRPGTQPIGDLKFTEEQAKAFSNKCALLVIFAIPATLGNEASKPFNPERFSGENLHIFDRRELCDN